MDHISASSLNMFLRCGAQWAFRYLDGIKSPPGAALTLGSTFHSSIALNYRQKVDTKVDLPAGDICDFFSDQFESARYATAWYEDEDPGEIKDSGIKLLSEYQTVIAPKLQPQNVEMEFRLTFKNMSETFLGYVDLVDDRGIIIETKTTSRRPSEIEASHAVQLAAYSIGYRKTYQKPEAGCRIDYAVKKKIPEVVSIPVSIEQADIDYLLGLVVLVIDAVNKGVFIPNRSNNYLCSHRWCGYADLCMKQHGGIVK